MISNPHKINAKVGIIIFNLGGPCDINDVEKFLFNLYFDKRIIPWPYFARFLMAKIISKFRCKKATEIYNELGGKSPIVENTLKQAIALQNYLLENHPFISDINVNWRVFYCMRHSSPFLENIFSLIEDFDPKYIILLPLYPQYSTTTTESFFDIWREISPKLKVLFKTIPIFDYHENELYIDSCKEVILNFLNSNDIDTSNFRFLFSAHGLPESIVAKGDPYQKQTENSFNLIVEKLESEIGKIDAKLCYQSKVGIKKWLTPSLLDEIKIAGADKKDVIIFSVSFVSEHSETLVELDIEVKNYAKVQGIKQYFRIPTLNCSPKFIKSLGEISACALKSAFKKD